MSSTSKDQMEFLQALCEATDKVLCQKCGCCEMVWEDCETCGGDGWEVDEDTSDFDDDNDLDFYSCGICDGKGGFNVCIGRCDEEGNHKPHSQYKNV